MEVAGNSSDSFTAEKSNPASATSTVLVHRIFIHAPIARIYQAITTEEGIRGWWTTGVVMAGEVGGPAIFSFEGGTRHFRMIIERLEPFSLVQWRCEGGSAPEWLGTTLRFSLQSRPETKVLLDFRLTGWRGTSAEFAIFKTDWEHWLVLLKRYAAQDEKAPSLT
jgi:uncharacterized protein YndB with AHSA1/START domain